MAPDPQRSLAVVFRNFLQGMRYISYRQVIDHLCGRGLYAWAHDEI